MHDTVKGVTAQQLKGPDRLERMLGLLSLVMLAVILVAVMRGRAEWAQIPGIVWLHLATMLTALALTPMCSGGGAATGGTACSATCGAGR
ncbi:hypothetical protein [Sphingomonas sp. IC081]|uniref:hypothetical protein n=1 Tax=Sphingomonas sp. IC081 TaxID=304378 RepID=UPI0021AE4424|nr:hypothetical protein [Sphingomonas sp. IC081]